MPRLGLLLLVLAAAPAWAQADARLKYLVKRLEKASDARGRTQAALILGTSEEPSVVQPLCKAASADPEAVVRGAAAKALAELGEPSALDCLEPRVKAEGSPEARKELQAAIAALEKIKNQKPVLYLVLQPLKDERPSPEPQSAKLAEQRLRQRLQRLGVVLAAPDVSAKAGQAVMKAKKVKGYLAMTKIRPHDGGGIRLVLVCATWPRKQLLGEVSVKAAGADPATLVKALVPALVKNASETFEWGISR